MPSLAAVGIIVLALLITAALFLMYEIGKLVGEKTATDKFPEAKKAAVQRSRSVLGGMFAEQLAPYLPDFPFSPTEAKFIGQRRLAARRNLKQARIPTPTGIYLAPPAPTAAENYRRSSAERLHNQLYPMFRDRHRVHERVIGLLEVGLQIA
jgi:hypothetical protein